MESNADTEAEAGKASNYWEKSGYGPRCNYALGEFKSLYAEDQWYTWCVSESARCEQCFPESPCGTGSGTRPTHATVSISRDE